MAKRENVPEEMPETGEFSNEDSFESVDDSAEVSIHGEVVQDDTSAETNDSESAKDDPAAEVGNIENEVAVEEEVENNVDLTSGPLLEVSIDSPPQVVEYFDTPIMKLLKSGRKAGLDDDEELNREKVINQVFDQFNVKAKVSSRTSGPQVTRFEVQMGRGTRIENVSRLKDEIRLALAVDRITILAPVPGRNVVGIEVQRKFPDIVSLGDVLRSQAARQSNAELLIGVGQTVEGAPVIADIADMPHLLVAGATGSGKSCFINSLICSILVRPGANQVGFVLIDPKRVELTQYAGIPQLALPVAHDPADALAALNWVNQEMDSRYRLFERHRVNKIDRYNEIDADEKSRYPNDPISIPRLVVVVDELADLIKTTNHEAENLIIRLTQLGRAAGVHVVVATQRPSVDVITGLIKANISSRLAFATASQVDSRVILDQTGAETLAGKGDGLLSLSGISSPIRIQGTYVDEDEIRDIVGYVIANQEVSTYVWPKQSPSTAFENLIQSTEESETKGLPSDNARGAKSALAEAMSRMTPNETGVESVISDSRKSLMEFEAFVEPDWREILDLLERRIEPCDLTGAMVDVSLKRKLWRSIEASLSHVRVVVMKRLADRSEFRYRERIKQDDALSEIKASLQKWHTDHSNSISWQFFRRAIEQVEKAAGERDAAIARVSSNESFRNLEADQIYSDFAKGIVLPPIIGLYVFSVLVLTDNRFHFILKYIPPFNLGMLRLSALVFAFVAYVWLRTGWRYSSKVRDTQAAFVRERRRYEDSVILVTHAEDEYLRLSKQVEVIEPFLKVLSEGYRARWSIDESLNVDVSTELDTSKLPACVGFARAVDGPDDQISKLRELALRQVVRPGWRTEIIRRLGEEYGAKLNRSLHFSDLDSDAGATNFGARELFSAAFNDKEMANRLGRTKLFELVSVIHNEVIRKTNSDLRPPVKATRLNGFETIDTSSAWLAEVEYGEDWIEYLSEILHEATPFSYLNITSTGRRSPLSQGRVESFAVVPPYLVGKEHQTIDASTSKYSDIAPIDVVVRVDVSEWGKLEDFVVFEAVENLNDLPSNGGRENSQNGFGF